MIVLKFGGTSVGTTDSLRNVKQIVESLTSPAIIVVSALGGLTDRLIATARKAASGDSSYSEDMQEMAERHRHIIADLIDDDKRQEVTEKVEHLLSGLRRLYDGVSLIADLPARTMDAIVSYGERMSSVIVAGIIRNGVHHNSPDFIKTEKWFNKNIADAKLTTNLIKKEFGNKLSGNEIAITGGFISSDRDTGEITNLGRGGSDYTAALIAAALDADELQIWTDVDGFMTADPRIIPSANVIPYMTFVESMELCTFGAKVIYPPTIYPVFHKNIPIKILNTFNLSAPGTLISDCNHNNTSPVTGISSVKDTCLIRLNGEVARNAADINSRTFNTLARKGISVFLVSQDGENNTFSFALSRNDAFEAMKLLSEEFAPETSEGTLTEITLLQSLATVAVVGENLSKIEGIIPRVINTLACDDIHVSASSDGSSKTTATFVIRESDTPRALRLVHSLFFQNND